MTPLAEAIKAHGLFSPAAGERSAKPSRSTAAYRPGARDAQTGTGITLASRTDLVRRSGPSPAEGTM
jgi:hypothetical protein